MSVTITFEPSGISGMVATGTYLIDAAKRLGAPVGPGCSRGKAPCVNCLVKINSGSDLLSPIGSIEESLLTPEQRIESLRLACQVKLEGDGEVIIRVVRRPASAESSASPDIDFQKQFSTLSLEKKIATLLQLEAITVSEALNAAIEKPLAFGTKALDRLTSRARASATSKASRQK